MVIQGGKELPKRPAEVVGVLRQHNVTLAERDHSTPREQKAFQDLIALFEAYQISYDRVHVCGFCIGKRRYKPVNANFVRHEGERICMDCAQTELRRELSFRGFVRYNHFYTLLNKVRDLDRVIRFLDSGVDPDLTRYDVLSKQAESYQSVAIDELSVDNRLNLLLKASVKAASRPINGSRARAFQGQGPARSLCNSDRKNAHWRARRR